VHLAALSCSGEHIIALLQGKTERMIDAAATDEATAFLEDPNELAPSSPWPTFPSNLVLPSLGAAGTIPSALRTFLACDIRRLSRSECDQLVQRVLPVSAVEEMPLEWQDRLLNVLSAFAPGHVQPATSELQCAASELDAITSFLRSTSVHPGVGKVFSESLTMRGPFQNSFEVLAALTETADLDSSPQQIHEPRESTASSRTRFERSAPRKSGKTKAGGSRRNPARPPKVNMPAESVIVEDAAAARLATTALAEHSRIAVDCEGVLLSRKGRLCLIQVASPVGVYFFDIVKGGRELFDSGLRYLLESASVVKVMHDCRHDCDALLHQFDVRLAPVVDTQVAFTVLRRVRNLKVGLPVSLKTLLKKFVGISEDDIAMKIGIKAAMGEKVDFWLQRPLPPDALHYARFDVVYLLHVAKVLELHVKNGDTLGWDKVIEESASYASLFRDDEDGPRKAGLEWARLVTVAEADRVAIERAQNIARLQKIDPIRLFRFERDLILMVLSRAN
jgi:3'-5' exonuclease